MPLVRQAALRQELVTLEGTALILVFCHVYYEEISNDFLNGALPTPRPHLGSELQPARRINQKAALLFLRHRSRDMRPLCSEPQQQRSPAAQPPP